MTKKLSTLELLLDQTSNAFIEFERVMREHGVIAPAQVELDERWSLHWHKENGVFGMYVLHVLPVGGFSSFIPLVTASRRVRMLAAHKCRALFAATIAATSQAEEDTREAHTTVVKATDCVKEYYKRQKLKA